MDAVVGFLLIFSIGFVITRPWEDDIMVSAFVDNSGAPSRSVSLIFGCYNLNVFPTNDTCRLIACSLQRLVKGDRPFGEGRAKTSGIIRWTNQRKEK